MNLWGNPAMRPRTLLATSFFALHTPLARASEPVPFSREISLLGGVSRGQGSGIENQNQAVVGFQYARSFSAPEAEHFLLRIIADTLRTHLKPSSAQPLADLAAAQSAQATLIRFAFSGCYLWSASWMGCFDDGPRISWLSQGNSDAQVLGSFPLGLSLHNGEFFPWIFTLRTEVGRWERRKQGQSQANTLSLAVAGVGYNW